MALQGSSRSRHFKFRFQPVFSIIEVVLGAFAHMDACPLLITSIVAVKPEDQGTFFQDFLGLSGYLCSIGGFYSNTALLRTRNAQNHNEAQRPALPAWGGSVDPPSKRDSAKARNMLKKRADSHHHGLGALPRVGCTLCWAATRNASINIEKNDTIPSTMHFCVHLHL